MIFDLVVSSALEESRQLGPLVTVQFVSVQQQVVFLSTPLALIDERVEVVESSLSALLSIAPEHPLGNNHSVPRSHSGNKTAEAFVFLWFPVSFVIGFL